MLVKTVILEAIKIGDEKQDKNGKQYWQPGIKTGGKWYNGFMRAKEMGDINTWQEGQEVTLAFFQEEFNDKMYSKFKFAGKIDYLEVRVAALELKMQKYEQAGTP